MRIRRGGEISSTCRRNAPQVLNIEDLFYKEGGGEPKIPEAEIAFSEKETTSIHHRNDDHMVITVMYHEW